MQTVALALICLVSGRAEIRNCPEWNYCSGHGKCDVTAKNGAARTCVCDRGYGSDKDVVDERERRRDCSRRTCPPGYAWGQVPVYDKYGNRRNDTRVVAHDMLAECSNMGTCENGNCQCAEGFAGLACERLKCPGEAQGMTCSDHGQCLSIQQLSKMPNAFPLTNLTDTFSYGTSSTSTWDAQRVYACLCDSTWPVGLGSGETQVAEYFGPDCSLRRCPSGDDPMSSANDTDCSGQPAPGGMGIGESGNLCHVECSNRGSCDYDTGTCTCFDGFRGPACSSVEQQCA